MTNQSSSKKFWSFKDTTNYSHIKKDYMLGKANVARIFIFKKSFLLEVSIDNELHYAIPSRFISQSYPSGFYTSICNINGHNISFTDEDIKKIL